jgi:hydrogenase maturation protease
LMDVTTLRPEYLLGMKGKRRILIVDAAEIGRRAGDWIRVEIKADKTSPRPFNKLYSSHDLHLTDIFLMGCILNLWPACIELYAVQSAQYDWGAGLSRQVRKAVPLLCDEIVRQLNSSSRSNVPEGCI